jgi:hypothetical protein
LRLGSELFLAKAAPSTRTPTTATAAGAATATTTGASTTATTGPTTAAAKSSATGSAAPGVASATIAFFARTRFVDVECSPFQFLAIESSDGGLSFAARGHFNESESFGFAGEFVFDDGDRCHLPEGFEGLAQVFFGGLT